MKYKSVLTGERLKNANKALREGRLFWCVTDRYGRPANGGDQETQIELGKWSKEVKDPKICNRGYHVTTDPLFWKGEFIWLVEVDKVWDSMEDKIVCSRRRALGLVNPKECIDPRILVASIRPNLSRADLSYANLSHADLSRATMIDVIK